MIIIVMNNPFFSVSGSVKCKCGRERRKQSRKGRENGRVVKAVHMDTWTPSPNWINNGGSVFIRGTQIDKKYSDGIFALANVNHRGRSRVTGSQTQVCVDVMVASGRIRPLKTGCGWCWCIFCAFSMKLYSVTRPDQNTDIIQWLWGKG